MQSGLPLISLYFLSGIPALIYQTVWQRILVLHSGVGTISVAIIVSAYMLGIGLGSLLGAGISRRLSPARTLQCFAFVELLIGGVALISPWFLYEFLYVQHGQLYRELFQAAILHIIVLLLPTTLMGLTLPLMTRSLVVDSYQASSRIARLYGANTMGAAFGAVIAPWLLMPLTGAHGAIVAGAMINLIIAVTVFWLHSRNEVVQAVTRRVPSSASVVSGTVTAAAAAAFTVPRTRQPDSTVVHHPPQDRITADRAKTVSGLAEVPLLVWSLLYFLSGLIAIGLEIIWFRVLDIAVKSTSFTFGTILGTYLFCMAIGSLAGARGSGRVQHPLRAFLQVQCLILMLSGLIIFCVVRLPADIPGLAWFTTYWASEEPFRPSIDELSTSLKLYVLQPVVLMSLPTFLMGYSFCLLQKGVQRDAASSGYRVGLLQAANILGCTLGSLLTGVFLLDVIGSMTTLRVMLACGLMFAVTGFCLTKSRSRFGILAVGLVLVIIGVPGNDQLWLRLHGQPADGVALVSEDVTGVCMLAPQSGSDSWWLWASGKTQSLLPFGGFHAKLGVLPVTLHKDPQSIAIIGLGSGDTAWAAGCRTETKSLRVFEICTPEIDLLTTTFARSRWPQLDSFLNDPRVTIDGVDARFALATEEVSYDVIEADAIRHHGAFAGYLYSVEFFRLCGKRLKPGGYMCSWSPTPLVQTTFRLAFPHVLEMENGLLLIGSNDPIELDLAAWETRLRETSGYLTESILQDCLNSLPQSRLAAPVAPNSMTNTDLFPFDEFN
jgi:predicted membrane-bound spermidine synthase